MKQPILTLIIGAGLGAIGMSGPVQSAAEQVFGAFASHGTEETYQISVGATAGGKESPRRLQTEFRNTSVVPDHYGVIVGVTSTPAAATVWYEDTDGALRNVILYEPDNYLYRLERRPSGPRDIRLIR